MQRRRTHVLIDAIAIFSGLLLLASSAAASSKTWSFRVFLDDKPIGHQRFVVDETDGSRAVSISARFEVKLLSLTIYRYTHDASEQWRDDCLRNLSARTDDNGKQSTVSTESGSTGLLARGSAGTTLLSECPMSFAYWNPRMLQQTRLLNSQTGAFENVSINAMGDEKIRVRDGEETALRYRISGLEKPIDLWYSRNGEWVGLAAVVGGGRTLRYQLEP